MPPYFEPMQSSLAPGWTAPPKEDLRYIYPAEPPVADASGVEQLINGYRRQGKVVLLDAWSITHPASRERIPQLIGLHRRHRAYGLQVIGLAFDNPGLWKKEIAPYLRSLNCSYPCVVVPPSAQGELIARLAYDWDGSLPAVLVYDRDGRVAAELFRRVPFGRIEQTVELVLAGKHQPIEESGPAVAGRISARSRTLDVENGKTVGRSNTQWIRPRDVTDMAEAIARKSEPTIDWSEAKVAVLPFTILGRNSAGIDGKALADEVARILTKWHPQAVVDRAEADALLAKHGLTPLGVEYDLSVLQGKADWTHVITGTLRMK